MNEQFSYSSRFSDFGGRWTRTDNAALWGGAATATEAGLDLEAIPTIAEYEAGAEAESTISLVDEPHAIALPDIYEPGYAYPVIVWFHGSGGTEDDLFQILPQISERNYLGLSIRGNLPSGDGAAWASFGAGSQSLLQLIDDALMGLAGRFLVQRDRVFLAGAGTGGTMAVELFLQRPELFAGAASLCGEFPQLDHPLAHFRDLHGKRVLMSTVSDGTSVKIADLVTSGRLLYSAGVQVGTRVYQPSEANPSERMLRDLDHWIMDSIATAVKVSSR